MNRLVRTALLVALTSVPAVALPARSAPPEEDSQTAADEQFLKENRVASDGPGLLEFLRRRSPTEAERQKMADLIRKLGSEVFRERQQATRDLIAWGPPALPLLREATKDEDREIGRRAERCVAAIEQGPGPALPMAAVRLLAKRSPEGAVPALLRFLPYAGDDGVEEETLAALVSLGLTQGKADPTLLPVLKDFSPARRAAAAYVLGRAKDQRSQEAVRKLLADAEPRVRLRAAQGLIAGRHKDAVPTLIALLENAPKDIAWRAEELLERLAADQSPPFPHDNNAEAARKKWREAWATWWKNNEARIDLARLEKRPRLLGLTIAIAWNVNKVWEVGPDGKTRWEMTVQGPMDAHTLPGNRVLIAESGSNKVTERDLRGNVVWEKAVDGEPINCGRLPNGNTWIGTRNAILEVTRDGKVVYQHKLCDGYLHGISRLRNGGCVGITNTGKIIELDAAGKEVRTVQLPQEGSWGEVEALPGGKYLVTNYGSGRVFEVDATGKVLWEQKVAGACGGTRLPNGHTLLACPQRVIEIDRSGKVVWEAAADGFVRRANRR